MSSAGPANPKRKDGKRPASNNFTKTARKIEPLLKCKICSLSDKMCWLERSGAYCPNASKFSRPASCSCGRLFADIRGSD